MYIKKVSFKILYLYLLAFCIIFSLEFKFAILNIIVYLPACILGFLALKKLFVGNIVKKQLAFLFFFFFLSMIYLIIVQIILLDAASLFPQFLFNILIAIGFCNFIFVSYDNNE
ncbi:hypothetical protein IPF27_03065, partial [Francisella tularensis]|nr:hypothetical protein [Francisella tularensis]